MSMSPKYVVIDHMDVRIGSAMKQHRDLVGDSKGKPTSAGFFKIVCDGATLRAKVFGHSHSLQIEPSVQEDENLIEHALRIGDYMNT